MQHSTPTISRLPFYELEPRHWFKAACVFVVITPVAIATIFFVLALIGGLGVLLLGAVVDPEHVTWLAFFAITASAIGGICTGLKSALETLPLNTPGDES